MAIEHQLRANRFQGGEIHQTRRKGGCWNDISLDRKKCPLITGPSLIACRDAGIRDDKKISPRASSRAPQVTRTAFKALNKRFGIYAETSFGP
jgi:hypothetical protein